MRQDMQQHYSNDILRKQHDIHAKLFSILQKNNNQKEQQFFAYIVTQVQALIEKYPQLTILRDIDETMCYRINPEE